MKSYRTVKRFFCFLRLGDVVDGCGMKSKGMGGWLVEGDGCPREPPAEQWWHVRTGPLTGSLWAQTR